MKDLRAYVDAEGKLVDILMEGYLEKSRHEATHAVISLAVQQRFLCVRVRDETISGKSSNGILIFDPEMSASTYEELRADAIVSLAGLVCEETSGSKEGAKYDIAAALSCAIFVKTHRLFDFDDPEMFMMTTWYPVAAGLVHDNWWNIAKVADALYDAGELSYQEVQAICNPKVKATRRVALCQSVPPLESARHLLHLRL
jgi:hypothetical protein